MGTDVLYSIREGTATVFLNRPDRLNTVRPLLFEELIEALECLAEDTDVRAVILTGAGRGFCAGADLEANASYPSSTDDGAGEVAGSQLDASRLSRVRTMRQAMYTSELLLLMDKVTIAAINGACAGVGLSWACACDIRYAARSAKFNTAFITAGGSGDFGINWTLPRIVGSAKARELLLLSEKFDAAEAQRIGLVSKVSDDGELLTLANETASRVANMAPIAVREIKRNQSESPSLTFSESLDREAVRHVRCTSTSDSREAIRAYLERRNPVFSGK
jgi:2-(1,2-epoxy-1,2-dihydrophenyl)acetyl-CoA isomerase